MHPGDASPPARELRFLAMYSRDLQSVGRFDQSSRGDDHCTLDGVFKFPNISRPVVTYQCAQCLPGNTGNETARALLVMLKKMNDERMNVFTPFAQRGQRDRENGQAIKE